MTAKRLLLIQDNPVVSKFLKDRLSTVGFSILGCSKLADASAVLAKDQIDGVLVDPLLPFADALQSLEALRAAPAASEVPIFFLPVAHHPIAVALEEHPDVIVVKTRGDVVELINTISGKLGFTPNGVGAFRGEVEARWKREVLSAATETLSGMRHALHPIIRSSGTTEPVRELLQLVHRFSDQLAILGPSALAQVAAALEIMLFGLMEFPERMDQLSLRTLSQSIDFLASLLANDDATRPADLRSAQIVVVEDEDNARELIIAALDLVGLNADGLDNPVAGLAVLSAQACDLIVLDVNLPEMDGYELCSKLRAMPMHEHTPIVFLTGMTSFQNRVQSNLSGANDFIGKPFNVAELGLKALIWVLRGRFGLN